MNGLSYFKALSDETRIRLLNILINHELSVNEMVTLMDMGQSRISRHLRILTDSGILSCRRDGVWAFYSVTEEKTVRKFIDSIHYLFSEDPELTRDLIQAKQVVENRTLLTKQFFNFIAAEWDLLKTEILGPFNLNKTILKKAGSCTSVVDLGCGTGELLSYFNDSNTKLIGVDSSANMLEEARKRFIQEEKNVDLRLGDLAHLPLKNQEVDLVIISLVLHHLSNTDSVVSEVERILKPGGMFLIADFDKHKDETMRRTYGDRWLGFSEKEINKLVIKNGFKQVDVELYSLNKDLKLRIYKAEKTINTN